MSSTDERHKVHDLSELALEYESFVNLKSKFDALVSKDADINKGYNNILHSCLGQVISEMRQKDSVFDQLYKGMHYGGSYYDKLAVGNLRHEFDLNVIFKVRFKPSCLDHLNGSWNTFREIRFLRVNSRSPDHMKPINNSWSFPQRERSLKDSEMLCKMILSPQKG